LPDVNDLLVGVLTALLATNSPTTVSNWLIARPTISTSRLDTAKSSPVPTNSPADLALKRVMELDDQSRAEIDDLITQSSTNSLANSDQPLKARVQAKLAPVRRAYEDFVQLYPNHAKGRSAFGAFLSDSDDEEGSYVQWLKAKELNPQDPAAWNNLANLYGHRGPVTNAFFHYAKAIELNPWESTYYHNLATTLYLFRADGAKVLKKDVTAVMHDAMALYRRALELDPTNFILAADFAQSYYGFPQPKSGDPKADLLARTKLADDALRAWTNAFRVARDDIERQGVQIHFARLNITAGRYDIARQAMAAITNTMYDVTKKALESKIETLLKDQQPKPAEKTAADPTAPGKP
jgi:tetratricopeptide (TPR) repeat protein